MKKQRQTSVLTFLLIGILITLVTTVQLKKTKKSRLKEIKHEKALIKAKKKIKNLFVLFFDPNSGKSQEAIDFIRRVKKRKSIIRSKAKFRSMNYIRNQTIRPKGSQSNRPQLVYFGRDGKRKEFEGIYSEKAIATFVKKQMSLSMMFKIRRSKQYRKIMKKKQFFFVSHFYYLSGIKNDYYFYFINNFCLIFLNILGKKKNIKFQNNFNSFLKL